MKDPWDVRTWTDAELREYAGRNYTCDIERTMIPVAQAELRRREAAFLPCRHCKRLVRTNGFGLCAACT